MSELQGVQPPAEGLELEVAGGDRFLVLTNGTGKEVVVMGYDDEPYLRFLPNRVVEVNTRAPSKYANEDRYALQPVPAERQLQGDAQLAAGLPRRQLPVVRPPHPPDGEGHAAAGEGRGQAHEDLRLGRADDGRRRSRRRRVGTLEWVPASSSGTSPLLFVGLGALVAADRRRGALRLVRRRRAGRPAPAGGPKPAEEAW